MRGIRYALAGDFRYLCSSLALDVPKLRMYVIVPCSRAASSHRVLIVLH